MGTNNTEDYGKMLKTLLDENSLKIKKVPEVETFHQGQQSLMRAISVSLYLTSVYHVKIQKLCVDFLSRVSETEVNSIHQLSERLRVFRRSTYLFKDYCDNPGLPSFENVISAQ